MSSADTSPPPFRRGLIEVDGRRVRVLEVEVLHDGTWIAIAESEDQRPLHAYWFVLASKDGSAPAVKSKTPKMLDNGKEPKPPSMTEIRDRDMARELAAPVHCRIDRIMGAYVVSTKTKYDDLPNETRLHGPTTRDRALRWAKAYDARARGASDDEKGPDDAPPA